MKNIKKHLSIVLILLLASCAGRNNIPNYANFSINQKNLKGFDNWNLQSRVIYKSNNTKNAANLSWVQEESNFSINVIGAFGYKILQLVKDENNTIFIVEGQKIDLKAHDLEADNIDTLGLSFIDLKYLLISVVDNIEYKNLKVDDKGLITSFEYNNWHIKYKGYQEVDLYYLPKSIELVNEKNNSYLYLNNINWLNNE